MRRSLVIIFLCISTFICEAQINQHTDTITINSSAGSTDLAGWMWDSKPKINDDSDESGRIKFKIKINAEGEIESVVVVGKSVSSTLVRKYQAEVEKMTFSKSNGQRATEGAIGYITFIIPSK